LFQRHRRHDFPTAASTTLAPVIRYAEPASGQSQSRPRGSIGAISRPERWRLLKLRSQEGDFLALYFGGDGSLAGRRRASVERRAIATVHGLIFCFCDPVAVNCGCQTPEKGENLGVPDGI